MSKTLYNILNNTITDKNRLLYYETRLNNYLKYYKMYSRFTLIEQNGGYIYNSYDSDNNISYNIDIYEKEYDINDPDNEFINKIVYIYNNDNNKTLLNSYCSMLSYTTLDYLFIDVIETPIKCIKFSNLDGRDMIKNKIKYGNLLMKIIIKYAKEKGCKHIRLEDRSMFNCLDSKNRLKYNLKNVHILTHGYPWQKQIQRICLAFIYKISKRNFINWKVL